MLDVRLLHGSDLLLELSSEGFASEDLLMLGGAHGTRCVEQLNCSITIVVEVSSVGDIALICPVHLISFHILLATDLLFLILILSVEEFAGKKRPGEELTLLVQRGEEAVLHAPKQILVLLTHAHTVNQVEMRERHHNNAVVVLDEGEAVAKLTIVDVIAHAADGFAKLVLLDPALEHLADIVDVKAGGRVVIDSNLVEVALRLVTHIKMSEDRAG